MWITSLVLAGSALFLALVVMPGALPEPKAHHGKVPPSTNFGVLVVILAIFAVIGGAGFGLLANA